MLYYAPTIFELTGFTSDDSATLATVGLGVVKVSLFKRSSFKVAV